MSGHSAHYNELLSGLKSFDICNIKNHEKSLVNVNKLSLGFFHRNNTNLIDSITERISKLQFALSPYIQHLQISVNSNKERTKFIESMIDFIQSQKKLKSLITFLKQIIIFYNFHDILYCSGTK